MSAAPPRWGFHELRDPYGRRLVASTALKPDDLVLDIGAGRGVVARRVVHAGARVVAFEMHPDRWRALQRHAGPRLKAVQGDWLLMPLPRQPFRVVANPPFGIVTQVLTRLTARGSALVRADLVVPRYVAGRWSRGAAPGQAQWGRRFSCEVAAWLPPAAFAPPNRQGAAVLRLQRR